MFIRPIVPECISAVAALMSAFAAFQSYRSSSSLLRISEISFNEVWQKDFSSWGSEVINVLSEAAYECGEIDLNTEASGLAMNDALRVCRWRLSALVERGRFSMLNTKEPSHGTSKSSSRKGFRHDALDPLVSSIKIIEGDPTNYSSRKEALNESRNDVVAFVQSVLAPADYYKRVSKLTSRFRPKHDDGTIGGLIPSESAMAPSSGSLLAGNRTRYGRGYRGTRERD